MIGVFDSGLGGLTAIRSLEKLLPDEKIIYFGDTGRVPYGTRSEDTIIKYVRQDMNFLMRLTLAVNMILNSKAVQLKIFLRDLNQKIFLQMTEFVSLTVPMIFTNVLWIKMYC